MFLPFRRRPKLKKQRTTRVLIVADVNWYPPSDNHPREWNEWSDFDDIGDWKIIHTDDERRMI